MCTLPVGISSHGVFCGNFFQDKNSWAVEKDMYKLPQMKHENVLAFLGASKNGDNLHVEYWLVTEYHERGSLSDHLKVQLPFPFCSSYRVFPAAYAASALRRAETPFRVHRPVMSGKACALDSSSCQARCSPKGSVCTCYQMRSDSSLVTVTASI